jgi:hypothetical protein
MARIPFIPRRSVGFESRVAGSNALTNDRANVLPIAGTHLVYDMQSCIRETVILRSPTL